jgi:hypothetical protein
VIPLGGVVKLLAGIELDGLAAGLGGLVDGFKDGVEAEAVCLAAGLELADFGGIGDRCRERGSGEEDEGEQCFLHGLGGT